ncbi:hypothetical protein CW304_02695 [Bacillus sp. UFRGS-B20]|nr:hypothetical protein CW304_02695 [Bacillus sp. UFRGS-B20]
MSDGKYKYRTNEYTRLDSHNINGQTKMFRKEKENSLKFETIFLSLILLRKRLDELQQEIKMLWDVVKKAGAL